MANTIANNPALSEDFLAVVRALETENWFLKERIGSLEAQLAAIRATLSRKMAEERVKKEKRSRWNLLRFFTKKGRGKKGDKKKVEDARVEEIENEGEEPRTLEEFF